jgi:hypothetical protein
VHREKQLPVAIEREADLGRARGARRARRVAVGLEVVRRGSATNCEKVSATVRLAGAVGVVEVVDAGAEAELAA